MALAAVVVMVAIAATRHDSPTKLRIDPECQAESEDNCACSSNKSPEMRGLRPKTCCAGLYPWWEITLFFMPAMECKVRSHSSLFCG